MYWIYVLECESNLYYVGETSKLFKRLGNHIRGLGCVNTKKYKPLRLVGLYKVGSMSKFLRYKDLVESGCENTEKDRIKYLNNFNNGDGTKDDARLCEDFITLEMHNGGLNVRGGKYLMDDRIVDRVREDSIYPKCECGYPCDIRKKYITRTKWKIYYYCSIKNVWDDMRDSIRIEVDKGCGYYQEYLDDIESRIKIKEYI